MSNKVTFEQALAQIKRQEESQSKTFKEKRCKQRDGLIRSGTYEQIDMPSECVDIINDNFWDLLL